MNTYCRITGLWASQYVLVSLVKNRSFDRKTSKYFLETQLKNMAKLGSYSSKQTEKIILIIGT